LTIDNNGGFKDGATQVEFTLTNTSGTWTSALAVLLPNSGGSSAASHIFFCAVGSCNPSINALASGFASNVAPVPLPSALLLFGPGLLGLAAAARKRWTS
jgi:hypothetical protein